MPPGGTTRSVGTAATLTSDDAATRRAEARWRAATTNVTPASSTMTARRTLGVGPMPVVASVPAEVGMMQGSPRSAARDTTDGTNSASRMISMAPPSDPNGYARTSSPPERAA